MALAKVLPGDVKAVDAIDFGGGVSHYEERCDFRMAFDFAGIPGASLTK
jgi:hypothetical protein